MRRRRDFDAGSIDEGAARAEPSIRERWRLATETVTKAGWTRMRSPWRGVTWLIGGLIALIAAFVAVVLALAFFLFAILTAVVLTLRAAVGGVRIVRPKSDPNLIEARRVGGHSWVAYGWDGRR